MDQKDLFCIQGMQMFTEKRFGDAAAQFELALSLDSGYLLALHGLARACFEARDLDRAIAAALRIVELDPNDVTAYSTLSQCYVFKEDKETAEHWGAKARIAGWKQQLKEDKKPGPPSGVPL